MAASLRVLTSPVRVTGGLRLAQLATLVTADTIAADARRRGLTAEVVPGVLSGDLASQLAAEHELAREGLDRAAVGRDEFIARARTSEADGRVTAEAALVALELAADLSSGAIDSDAAALAARTAFVRLYEAGHLARAERVVNTCPRCATVVDDFDAEPGTAPAQRVCIELTATNAASIALELVAPELLPGAVAIAVPGGHPAAGASVELPVAGREVPVVTDERSVPALVVPAHDATDLELARRLGAAPLPVLDAEGTVFAPGPLHGLGRYAARAAAMELLGAEGVVVSVDEVDEDVGRCRRCGTVLVPRLGRHWFLPMADLEVLAADAVRQGAVAIVPPSAGDDLLAETRTPPDWCVSHQVWAGQPVPVATCLDCGNAEVSVELQSSCGKCMGTLVPDDDVLDARFVGAVWPLAVAGWPHDEAGPTNAAPDTLLVVAPIGLVSWAVRMAALGLRLAGSAPFSCVVVHSRVDPLLYLEPVDPASADVSQMVDAARATAHELAAAVLGG